jgi:hypothetical protein
MINTSLIEAAVTRDAGESSSEDADRVIAHDKAASTWIRKDSHQNVHLTSPTFGDTITIRSP